MNGNSGKLAFLIEPSANDNVGAIAGFHLELKTIKFDIKFDLKILYQLSNAQLPSFIV
jgi:hypothetical protein